jgi:hypothetical protein
MKNRDRFVGLRRQDAKVYPCRVLMENRQLTERYISATKAAGHQPREPEASQGN